MDEVYAALYQLYSDTYTSHVWDGEKFVPTPAIAVCNHKQIDKILKCFDADEDDSVILECMYSCIGCIGDSVPALED